MLKASPRSRHASIELFRSQQSKSLIRLLAFLRAMPDREPSVRTSTNFRRLLRLLQPSLRALLRRRAILLEAEGFTRRCDRSGSLWKAHPSGLTVLLQPGRAESPRRSAGSGDVAQYRLARVQRWDRAEFSIRLQIRLSHAGASGRHHVHRRNNSHCSVQDEFPAASTFNAVVSCDATGQPVFHAPMKILPASLASRYRQYIIGIGRFRSTARGRAVLR